MASRFSLLSERVGVFLDGRRAPKLDIIVGKIAGEGGYRLKATLGVECLVGGDGGGGYLQLLRRLFPAGEEGIVKPVVKGGRVRFSKELDKWCDDRAELFVDLAPLVVQGAVGVAANGRVLEEDTLVGQNALWRLDGVAVSEVGAFCPLIVSPDPRKDRVIDGQRLIRVGEAGAFFAAAKGILLVV